MQCMCAQTRPRFILSSKRVFLGFFLFLGGGGGGRTHVNYKGKIPSTGKNSPKTTVEPCTKQDSESNTLPTELFRPLHEDSEPITLPTSYSGP